MVNDLLQVPSSSTQPSVANMQQGSRPRLVAKSTSGLRDTGSKSFKSGGKNNAGPDPMQVWNKNRRELSYLPVCSSILTII